MSYNSGMGRQITLTLPESLYEQAQVVAKRQNRPLSTILTDAITLDSPFLSEKVARRKANRWLVSYVGNLVMADNGQVVEVDGRVCWQFDVVTTSLYAPPQDPFASIHVDALNGTVLADETVAEKMIEDGITFTRTLP